MLWIGISMEIFKYFEVIVFILSQNMHAKTLRAVFSKLWFFNTKNDSTQLHIDRFCWYLYEKIEHFNTKLCREEFFRYLNIWYVKYCFPKYFLHFFEKYFEKIEKFAIEQKSFPTKFSFEMSFLVVFVTSKSVSK